MLPLPEPHWQSQFSKNFSTYTFFLGGGWNYYMIKMFIFVIHVHQQKREKRRERDYIPEINKYVNVL